MIPTIHPITTYHTTIAPLSPYHPITHHATHLSSLPSPPLLSLVMPIKAHLTLLLAALVLSTQALRLFMIGGKAYEDSLLFNDLAAAVVGR